MVQDVVCLLDKFEPLIFRVHVNDNMVQSRHRKENNGTDQR